MAKRTPAQEARLRALPCARCKVASRDGSGPNYCQACERIKWAEWASSHREACKAASKRYYDKKRAIIKEHKFAQGCADCGYREHVAALEFDHRPGEVWRFTIGNGAAMQGRSLAALRAEMAKCDVVCANCHAIRTYERGQNSGPASSRRAERGGMLGTELRRGWSKLDRTI